MKSSMLVATIVVIIVFWGCQKKNDAIPKIETLAKENPPFKLNVFPDSSRILRFSSPYTKEEIVVTCFKGHYIIDNDIILTEEQLNYLKAPRPNVEISIKSSGLDVKKNGAYIIQDPNGSFLNFWDNGIIPYIINSGFSSAHQAVILQAMTDWENVSGVDFVPLTGSPQKFISFVPTTNMNLSQIGVANTTGQSIYLGTANGPDLATAIHEIGHAMGLFHEHSRSDRGNFIRINTSNIASGKEVNFNTYFQNNWNGIDVGPFDFNSIMLYPSLISDPAFVNNITIPTLTRLDSSQWGRNTSISLGDAETASQLFGSPYAKLELVNKYYDETYSGQTHSIYSIDDIYIKVYADRLCTIPYTGSSSITVRLTYYEYTPSESKSHLTITIPSGTNSYLLYNDLVSKNYYADYGTPLYDETRIFVPRSGNFR
ncbi:M12 family metallopeptidase [Sediminibacterium goheungense]|uniref:Astacin (Peptidase family M12A) n=1 Tax=Sediminibacterium goheungense TaxID=1086393 RepID=A0A4R6IZQ5_9BACT|nr:M12 family metallopeptidase [Sediminibacterium goheungense]TDO28399.1 astacin (peptidase family M12A) [Sediminibacterium goheungense]